MYSLSIRILAITLAALATGCASVTGSPHQSIAIETRDHTGDPVGGANCELINNKGRWLLTTPGSVTVNKSNQDMYVTCTKEGLDTARQTVISETRGAMFGNIIIGGGIGALIDHSSGAAYDYPASLLIVLNAPGKQQSSTPLPQPTAAVQGQSLPASVQIQNLQPMMINSGKKPAAGDEWEYVAHDKIFGKKRKLLWRVKSVESSGVLEELLVDGLPATQWVFDRSALLMATPSESGLMMGAHWSGSQMPSQMSATGTIGSCARYQCQVNAKFSGHDRITVPAGTFDVVHYTGSFSVSPSALRFYGQVSFWYHEKSQRLIKQTVNVRQSEFSVDETIELQVARAYQ